MHLSSRESLSVLGPAFSNYLDKVCINLVPMCPDGSANRSANTGKRGSLYPLKCKN